MRLIDALSRIADRAALERRHPPEVLMDRRSLLELARCIESDLGGALYVAPYRGFEFHGIRFRPSEED